MRTVQFKFRNETKGAARYEEITDSTLDAGVIGTLYVRKSGLKQLGFDSIPHEFNIQVPEGTTHE